MVTWSKRYRSPEKGYSREGSKARTERILAEELEGRRLEIPDDLEIASLVFRQRNGALANAGPGADAQPHDSVADQPLVIEPLEVGDAGSDMLRALEDARRTIRVRAAVPETVPETVPEEERPGSFRALWRRLKALFS